MSLVLLTHPLPEDWIASLRGRVELLIGPESPVGFSPELLERLPEAEGLLTLLTDRVDEALLARAPRLRVVSNMAVGVDNVDVAACTRRGIPVGNTPGVLADATADLTLALLLAAARGIFQAAADARQGRWTTWSPTGWLGADLAGAVVGIVGMGQIGRAVARRVHGFGARIVYVNPSPRPQVEAVLGAERVPLERLLRESDFVTLHCPLNAETRHLIDADALRAMKPTAVLVNAARGAVVDTTALVQALRERWIAAAALDVTDPEPLPPEHPLYTCQTASSRHTSVQPHMARADAWPRSPVRTSWPGWRGADCRIASIQKCTTRDKSPSRAAHTPGKGTCPFTLPSRNSGR